MTTTSKSLLCAGLLAAAALGVVPSGARAQQYPNQDIHLICAFPPGSGADIAVRYYAEKLRPLTGRTVIVENRPGANGNVAVEYTARAKPDGYTIFLHGAGGVAASMSTFIKPPVDVGKAIQLAGSIHLQPFMIVVDAKSPYNSVGDLTKALKDKGAKASYATTSNTGTVVGELYKQAAGLEVVAVNYKNPADALNDQTSGQIDFTASDAASALAQRTTGRVRIIAVTTAKRLQSLPDMPTMTEQGVKMDINSWWAPMVPSATPRPVVDQINAWFTAIATADETKEFLKRIGGDPFINTVDKAQGLFLQDIEDWRGYVKAAKIEPQG